MSTNITTTTITSIYNTINVCISSDHLDINYWIYVLNNTNERMRLIKLGEELDPTKCETILEDRQTITVVLASLYQDLIT